MKTKITQITCDGCGITYIFKKPQIVEASEYEADEDGYRSREVWFQAYPKIKHIQDEDDNFLSLGLALCSDLELIPDHEAKDMIKEAYWTAQADIIKVDGRKVYLTV